MASRAASPRALGLLLFGLGGFWGGGQIRRGEGLWDEVDEGETVMVRRRTP